MWNKLTLKQKLEYCTIHKLTLLTAQSRYNNDYKE